MPIFHDHLEQGSQAWLDFRKDKITATMIATIMGVNPYKSAYMLWQEILGLRELDAENDAMRRGKDLEPIALAAYCKILGREMRPAVVTHSTANWAMASLDAIDCKGLHIGEIKCMGKKNHEEAMNGVIQKSHEYQMQWQMYVTELFECDYFPFSEESNNVMTTKRDQELINKMIIAAEEFRMMLDTVTPPPFTDLDYEDKSEDAYWNMLCNMYERHNQQEKCAISEKDKVKNKMIEYANGRNVKGANSKFTGYMMQGKINYEVIPALKDVNLDTYRKPSVQCYRITTSKD